MEAMYTLLNCTSFEERDYVVEISCPSMMLKHGLQILDSPGMNEDETLTKTVRAQIRKVDGVIYLLDGGKGTITEKDKEALKIIRHSMSKPKLPFDCVFVVNRVDYWERNGTVEDNLDAYYKKLRNLMIYPGGISKIKTHIQPRFERIFPPSRRDCDAFFGLSARRAYSDGNFHIKPEG